MKNRILTICLIATLFACDNNVNTCKIPKDTSSCIYSLTHKENPPLEIWSYLYNNKTFYLVTPDCCDQYSQLYSSDCSLLCAPSGGFSGAGDGKCPDFFDKASTAQLVWKKE